MKTFEKTNYEYQQMKFAIQKILNSEIAFPFKLSYLLNKNFDILSNHLKTYEKEVGKLIQEVGEKDEDGQLIIDKDGKINIIKSEIERYSKERGSLDSIIELLSLHTVKEDQIDYFDNIETLTPMEVKCLTYLIEEE